jgi:hypothetical protein
VRCGSPATRAYFAWIPTAAARGDSHWVTVSPPRTCAPWRPRRTACGSARRAAWP